METAANSQRFRVALEAQITDATHTKTARSRFFVASFREYFTRNLICFHILRIYIFFLYTYILVTLAKYENGFFRHLTREIYALLSSFPLMYLHM